jgi:hypothetical protein
MGFDNNDNARIIEPAGKTTKVNIGIVVGVLLFLVIGGGAVA